MSDRVYRGKPDKQRDPVAKNAWKDKAKGKKAEPASQNQQAPRKPDETHPAPVDAEPKVEQTQEATKVKPKKAKQPKPVEPTPSIEAVKCFDDPAIHPSYGLGVIVLESDPELRFQPSCQTFIEISRLVYNELISDNPTFQDLLLPECFDYYATTLLWARIVSLKEATGQVLSTQEKAFLGILKYRSFSVPEPLTIYLRHLGTITCSSGQHLVPTFPQMPEVRINGYGGYYPIPDTTAVNLRGTTRQLPYLEIPCLGVLSQAVQQAISNTPAGPYQSRFVAQVGNVPLQPTQNLLGFKPLTNRSIEARRIATDALITQAVFPEDIPGSGFNLKLMSNISAVISTTTTFKITDTAFPNMTELGSASQLIVSRPLPDVGTLNINSPAFATSLTRETNATFGLGIFTAAQFFKEPANPAAPDHSTWMLFQFTAALPIPQPWVLVRNNFRNLPAAFYMDVFQVIDQPAPDYRQTMIKSLRLIRR
jgi:hypothetical protein